jgi:ceramide glucosyltransferase
MAALSLLLLLLVMLGAAYTLFALVCVLAFFRAPRPCQTSASAPGEPVPVSILKPVKGIDPSASEGLLSFCLQDYPRYEVLFGFREGDDPAIPLVAHMVATAPCDGRLVVTEEGSGSNQKVVNLQGLVRESRYPLLAVSDSDMVVDGSYLSRIVAEFRQGKKTGMVTSLYKISRPSCFGSALESLSIALDFIPSVLVARQVEGITFGLGASMLFSREALCDIGGFGAVADYLADDYQLGFRLWQKGYENILSRHVIENQVGRMSLASYLMHQLRWARTYRASRPKGFLGYGITHIFPFALLLACIGPDMRSLAAMGIVLALRYGLALALYRKVITTRGWLKWLFLVPLKDVFTFLIWLWSLWGSKVYWRGRYYRVIKGGKMVEVRRSGQTRVG